MAFLPSSFYSKPFDCEVEKTRFLSDLAEKGWILKTMHRMEANSHCVEGWSWVRWLAVEGGIVETKLQPEYCDQGRVKFRFRCFFFIKVWNFKIFRTKSFRFRFGWEMFSTSNFKKSDFARLIAIEWRRWRRGMNEPENGCLPRHKSNSSLLQWKYCCCCSCCFGGWVVVEEMGSALTAFRRQDGATDCDATRRLPPPDLTDLLLDLAGRREERRRLSWSSQQCSRCMGKGRAAVRLFDLQRVKWARGENDCLMWPNGTENKTEPYNAGRGAAENNWTGETEKRAV